MRPVRRPAGMRPASRRARPPARLAALLIASALGAALIAGCSSPSGGGAADTRFVAGDSILTLAPKQREQPVDLAGTTLDGQHFDLATVRGKPVVVNVWASWCGPCRKEAKDLQAAYERLKSDDVAFVGINTRDEAGQAKAFERSFGIGYPSLVDDGGRLLLALRGAVPPSAIPTTLVLDAQGRIAARSSIAITTATLVALVEDVLAE